MSRIVAIFELQGFTQKNYDDIIRELKGNNIFLNEQRPSHVSFQKGDAWCVIDVWDSAEDLMQFGQTSLFPIFAKLGLTPPQPQIFPAYNYAGKAEEFTSS